jgi:hypothetical protein
MLEQVLHDDFSWWRGLSIVVNGWSADLAGVQE